MRAHRETVRARNLLRPLVDITLGDLDDTATALANEMMVMTGRAHAVPRLRRIVSQHVDRVVFREQAQGPIHGRETDPAPALTQSIVRLLRRERLTAVEECENFRALFRLTHRRVSPSARARAARYPKA
jgi:hypothetical protein